MHDRSTAACFSGYRPEKFSFDPAYAPARLVELRQLLENAVRTAHTDGYTVFLSGMSRGFDLWAAQAVLRLREELGLHLICALPFDGQSDGWEAAWQTTHRDVLMRADQVFSLAHQYTPDCFHVRNRFLVDGASRLICWWDGMPGGTQYTLRYAKRQGLTIVNLADTQLSLFD